MDYPIIIGYLDPLNGDIKARFVRNGAYPLSVGETLHEIMAREGFVSAVTRLIDHEEGMNWFSLGVDTEPPSYWGKRTGLSYRAGFGLVVPDDASDGLIQVSMTCDGVVDVGEAHGWARYFLLMQASGEITVFRRLASENPAERDPDAFPAPDPWEPCGDLANLVGVNTIPAA